MIVKANATFMAWASFVRHELIGRKQLPELFPVGDRIFMRALGPIASDGGHRREIAVEFVTGGRGKHG